MMGSRPRSRPPPLFPRRRRRRRRQSPGTHSMGPSRVKWLPCAVAMGQRCRYPDDLVSAAIAQQKLVRGERAGTNQERRETSWEGCPVQYCSSVAVHWVAPVAFVVFVVVLFFFLCW